jgi:rhodanese-related sulfurtransferase
MIVTASNSAEGGLDLSQVEKIVLAGKGKSAGKSVEDIARMHGVPVKLIDEQIKIGMKVEQEHVGDDPEKTRKIAMDHLVENPYYYTLLAYMEKAGEEALDDGLPEGLCPFAYKMAKAYVKGTEKDWNYITPEELKKDLDRGKKHFILDVRKPEDYEKEHIPGAINIFWLDLFSADNLKKLPRDKKIVVVCYVGHTSSQAVVLLKLIGFEAMGLKFGMGQSPVEGVPVAGWKDFGFETVKGKK